MSILAHPYWPLIRPHVRIEIYDRDGGHSHPRYRIEVQPPDDQASADWQQMTVHCVACGEVVHPIRDRAPANNKRGAARHLYYTGTCPIQTKIGCSRGREIREEYVRVRTDVEKYFPHNVTRRT